MQYYVKYGIGELSAYQRSGTELSTLINIASSFGGGDSPEITPDQIYSQLAIDTETPTEKVVGQLKDWDEMPEVKQQQLISIGLCDEDGIYKAPNTI
jgi:hypothetical protein